MSCLPAGLNEYLNICAHLNPDVLETDLPEASIFIASMFARLRGNLLLRTRSTNLNQIREVIATLLYHRKVDTIIDWFSNSYSNKQQVIKLQKVLRR